MIFVETCEPSTSLDNFDIQIQNSDEPESHFVVSRSRSCPKLLPDSLIRVIAFSLTILSLLPPTVHATAARCYFFGPGMTITGSDYRRDFGLSQIECANYCKMDSCCMAFEYIQGECTLKTRSLNGTISPKEDSIFGLCLDFEDEERDRFWDHELGGAVLDEKPLMDRESCSDFCRSVEKSVIYSWRTSDSRNMDAQVGHCKCIGVLHSIKLSFGSFAGFLI